MDLLQWFIFFDKKTSDVNKGTGINSDVVSKNKYLAKELHKPFFRKFEKRKVYSPFIGNVWGTNFADM